MPEPENSLPKGFWTKQIISINSAELNVIAFVSKMDEKHIVSAFPMRILDVFMLKYLKDLSTLTHNNSLLLTFA